MQEDIKVAILDNSIDPRVYNPVNHWSKHLDFPWQAFRPQDGEFPDWSVGFTHVIITGSEASILNRDAWVNDEIELVKEAAKRGLSLLGSCYGHQILTISLAGFRHVRKCVQPEIGWLPIEITQESDLLGRPRTVYAFSSHFDEVADLGEEFKVLSRTEYCAVQAFQWKEKSVWGLQYHPEMDVEEASEYMKKTIRKSDFGRFHYETGMKTVPRDSGLIHRIMRRFIKKTKN